MCRLEGNIREFTVAECCRARDYICAGPEDGGKGSKGWRWVGWTAQSELLRTHVVAIIN